VTRSLPRAGAALLAAVVALGGAGCRKQQESAPSAHAGAAAEGPARGLTEQERRGREIYLRGVTADGRELTGYVGPERAPLAGSLASCGKCHGADGWGTSEGGIVSPPIDGPHLFRAVETTEPGVFPRPAYDDEKVKRLVRRGETPTGRQFSVAMPRFEMEDRDLDDLLAYLRKLGVSPDPGVRDDAIVVGSTLPLTGRLAPIGEDVKAVLDAFFQEVNERGGVYRRRIEVRYADDAAMLERRPGAADPVERLAPEVFALVGCVRFSGRASDALLARDLVPLVGPIGQTPVTGEEESRVVFFVYPGVDTQARAVVQHLAMPFAGKPEGLRFALAAPRGEVGDSWVGGALDEAMNRDVPEPAVIRWTPGAFAADPVLAAVKGAAASAIAFSGSPPELSRLLVALEKARLKVPVYAPASRAGRAEVEIPKGMESRLRFTYPALFGETLGPGMDEFFDFLKRHQLQPRNMPHQVAAYVSASLFVEALKRARARVSRAGLIAALESVVDYDTGLTPPITYGTDRRIGILGAYLVSVDPPTRRLKLETDWIGLAP
jgi:ABC-type branched-subunit amino acid transport system substrate-binding protein